MILLLIILCLIPVAALAIWLWREYRRKKVEVAY